MLRRCFLALAAAMALPAAAAPDTELWQRLQGGGHVLLMRHAATTPGIGDPPGFRLDVCSTQRNLSEQGRRDAAVIGTAFRTRGIPLGPVWSSRWCRCLDTARLAFGRVEQAPMIDSIFRDDEAASRAKVRETLARIASWRQQGTKDNLVLVTHDVNIRALVDEFVAQGEIVVARFEAGRLEVLGRLRAHGGDQ